MRNRVVVFLILLVSFAAIFSSATFYILSPRASQAFMSFAVYSQDGLQQYVPTPNSIVFPGNTTTWKLSITNTMGSTQLVRIIGRIGGNETIVSCSLSCSPNSTTPASWFPQVESNQLFVADGESSDIMFIWTLEPGSNQTQLNLLVNGKSVNSAPIGAKPGGSVRWIFELWSFDPSCSVSDPTSSSCFFYGFGPKSSPTGIWLQVWFRLPP